MVWLSGLSTSLRRKGSLVQFPVRVYDWVASQVPSRGHTKGNKILMFFSLPSPLSKNKQNLKTKGKKKKKKKKRSNQCGLLRY